MSRHACNATYNFNATPAQQTQARHGLGDLGGTGCCEGREFRNTYTRRRSCPCLGVCRTVSDYTLHTKRAN